MEHSERLRFNRKIFCILCAVAQFSLAVATILPVIGMLEGWPVLGEAVAINPEAIIPDKRLVAYEGMFVVHGDQFMTYLLLPALFAYFGTAFASIAFME